MASIQLKKEGSVTERLEHWNCNSEALGSIPPPPIALAGFVLVSPEFNSSVVLVNSQLVCVRPVDSKPCYDYFHWIICLCPYLRDTIMKTLLVYHSLRFHYKVSFFNES